MTPRCRIIPIFVPHLGCPHDCVFCNQRKISGAQKPATAGDVESLLREALQSVPERAEIAFYGGSFTAIPRSQQEELLEAAESFLPTGRICGIRLSTRPDAMNAETASFLRSHHVTTVELGAQSMDDRVLALSERGHTCQDTVRAAKAVREAGLHLILQMMTGLPGSSPESDMATGEKIAALRPDGVRIYPTVIIRDTRLYDLWQEGIYREHTVEDAVEVCSRLLPLFRASGIPVIRLGLNPTEDLSSGQAAGGAYHPALGELVMAREMRTLAEDRLAALQVRPGDRAELLVPPSCVSKMTGQHRCNLAYLREKYDLKSVRVLPGDTKDPLVVRILSDTPSLISDT